MRIVAAVFADFEHTFLGGPSRLLADLAGQSVLERTLRRLLCVEGLDGRCLFVRPRDRETAQRGLADWGLAERIELLPLDDGRRPRRELLRSARKWGLGSWRGTLLGTTWFDEYVEPRTVAHVLNHYRCDAVLCLDGHMPGLAPDVATAMVARQRDCEHEAALMFTQAPPGVAGIILGRGVVAELVEQNLPAGLLLAYRPEMPRGDPINQPICMHVDPELIGVAARLTGDTRRSWELLIEVLSQARCSDTSELPAIWRARSAACSGTLPNEVEIELTTENPLPQSCLRPMAPGRRLAGVTNLHRVANELAAYDDSLVVLGGTGDPLQCREFPEVCELLRASGICGIAVVSPLVDLSDDSFEALFAARVDVLQVPIGAHSRERYRQIHGRDAFDQVRANLQRIQDARRQRLCPQPIVVPTITRMSATLDEIEPFYDHWIRETGAAVIDGYQEYCGRLPPDTVLGTEPPIRRPCGRLSSRAMLLADGTVSCCDQDVLGRVPLGRWDQGPLSAIWNGPVRAALRGLHERGGPELARHLCGQCREWFRP